MNCIIPAAGKSSRFSYKKSKVLFKINNETIIEKIFKKISKFSDKIIIVCNKENSKEIKKILSKYKNSNIIYTIQSKQNGMATAIKNGLKFVNSNNFFVVWADMIYLKKKTIKKTINNHLVKKNILTFPYYKVKNPYTYIVKDKNNKFQDILQRRETYFPFKTGDNDCGFFVCKTNDVKKELCKLINNKKILTVKTKEYDFLKSFKYLKKLGNIFLVKANSKNETKGINFKKDIING